MADVFIEHLVIQKKSAVKRLIGVGYVAALVVLIMLALTFTNDLTIILMVLVGGVWLVVRLIKNLDTEFEYILTNGEVDIDRISGKSKRKRLVTVDCRTFEIIAPDNPGNFAAYDRYEFKEKMDVSSGGEQRWFAVCPSKQGGKLLIYFEPDDRMLEAFRMYNSRAVR